MAEAPSAMMLQLVCSSVKLLHLLPEASGQ